MMASAGPDEAELPTQVTARASAAAGCLVTSSDEPLVSQITSQEALRSGPGQPLQDSRCDACCILSIRTEKESLSLISTIVSCPFAFTAKGQ